MGTKTTIELDKRDYISLLKRIKFFQNTVQELTEKKPLDKLLDQIISASKKLLDAEAASLLLFNKQEGYLYFYTLAGGTESSLKSKKILIGEGIAGWVAEKKKSLIINDCYGDERFNKEFDVSSGFRTRNMICVPMIQKEEFVGVIQVINKKNASVFSKEDLDLFEALAAQCAVTIENARLIDVEIKSEQTKHEMETAWKIQSHFLPHKLPRINNVEMSIRLKPAKEIGGDYFNVIKINEENTLFFIADVSGKSVPAALIVSTIYSFLQIYFIVQNDRFDPIEMVQSFNRFLINSTTPDKFATAWFGIFNSNSKTLFSINAGHNPPYLLKANENVLTKLSAGGLMLGSMDLPFSSETIQLEKDDLVFFYTDGIPEAMNISEEEFGEERFENLLIASRKLEPNELSRTIFDEVKSYRATAEQSDDITLGIIKIL
jgi:sigma-B regulation protein RsbU (phosphoserine phosphatase)